MVWTLQRTVPTKPSLCSENTRYPLNMVVRWATRERAVSCTERWVSNEVRVPGVSHGRTVFRWTWYSSSRPELWGRGHQTTCSM